MTVFSLDLGKMGLKYSEESYSCSAGVFQKSSNSGRGKGIGHFSACDEKEDKHLYRNQTGGREQIL